MTTSDMIAFSAKLGGVERGLSRVATELAMRTSVPLMEMRVPCAVA